MEIKNINREIDQGGTKKACPFPCGVGALRIEGLTPSSVIFDIESDIEH
jgi:hypothetical protein